MPDIAALFAVDVSPIELIVRGSAIYWFIFLLFRLVLRRDAGSIAIADVLLLVLIADAAQNGMSGSYDSIGEAMILVATLVGWNLVLDWLIFRFDALRRLLEPRPLELIRDGRMRRANMKREMLREDDLMAKLREHGIERLSQVRAAYMESGGEITVLRRDSDAADATAPPTRNPAAH